jgi:hypothetical protein
MRRPLIIGFCVGLLAGFLLSGQVAISQEEPFPMPTAEARGRFQIAGHSTYPPLLLDSETGTSWILMSTAVNEEERRWVWEPIELGVIEPMPSPSTGRDIARLPSPSQSIHRKVAASKSRAFSW